MTADTVALQAELARLRQRVAYLEQTLVGQKVTEFNLLFEQLADAVFFVDGKRIIRYVNPAGCRLFGYPMEDLVGTTPQKLYAHPADYAARNEVYRNLAYAPTLSTEEIEFRRKDGTPLIAELIRTVPCDAQGVALGVLVFIRDISLRKATETALRESQHFIESVADASPNVTYIFNLPEQRNTYISRNVQQILGYSTETLLAMGKKLARTLLHPEDWQRSFELYDQFKNAKDEEILSYEQRYKHADGEYRWCYLRHMVFSRLPDGTVRDIIGTLEDRTEQKRAEQALQQSRQLIEQTFNRLRDLIWSYDLEEDRQDYMNPAVETILGLPPEAFLANNRLWQTFVHPDDLDYYFNLSATIRTQDETEGEYRVVRSDGQIRWLNIRAHLIRDAHGEPIRAEGITSDITERKAAEMVLRATTDQLATSRNALQRLITQLPVGIQVFDNNGLCIDVNDAHLQVFGLKYRRQVVGIYNIFEDTLAAAAGTQQAAQRVLAGETVHLGDLPFDFEVANPQFAGQLGKRIINVTMFPLFDQEGMVINIIGLNQDVTERYQAEQSNLKLAVQAERIKLLEELISDISHDLKTPIAIIGTSLYLLRKLATTEQNKYVERIEFQMSRLVKLIQDLLTMSRLNHAVDLKMRPINLTSLLRRLLPPHLPSANAKHITLTLALAGDNLPIWGDEDELARVFDNLIENALHYTPTGGHITVKSSLSTTGICVEISDTGIGIDEADLPHIFERFYRADKARATDTGGTGLGLAIVKRIVEMHQGSVTVSSRLNEGSTFCVILPPRTPA